jgi:two-component system phosphate regulon sensor histidine kinase PhoR
VTPYLQGQKLVVARDTTRVKTLEKIRRDFVANVSHELRTPLTVIRGYLELLQSSVHKASDMDTEVLARMDQEAVRMQRIVDELLYLARLEKSEPVRHVGFTDVETVLRQVEAEIRVLSQGRHQLEICVEAPTLVRVRQEDLFRVLTNLASNAVRYTPEDGRISMRWYRHAEYLCLAVEDSGIGIAPEDIPRVTERFFRTDSGRDRVSGGVGLGLAIVKHTLERYGAHLIIRSRPGQGSTFIAAFPQTLVADETTTTGDSHA